MSSQVVSRVGTIAGRHEMPVESYLVIRPVEPGYDAYMAAYEGAIMYAQELAPGDSVEVYFTGLTELTLGALDGFDELGINVQLMRYDVQSDTYQVLERKASRFVKCNFSPAGQRPHVYRATDYHCPTCGAV